MMDLSMGKDEKEYYIVNVKMKNDGENFVVFYADGHCEEHPFTAHNFNVYIYRMKHQFLDEGWKYKLTQEFIASISVVKEFKTLILSITGIILSTTLPIPEYLKTISIILLILYNVGYTLKQLLIIGGVLIRLGAYHTLEEFVEIMENFKINVIDPITGQEEDWYLVNIGDIEPNSDITFLKFISTILTDDYKKDEGQRISELLKEKFAKRLIKKPKEG